MSKTLITSAKSTVICKVTYPQVPGIRAWTSLEGDSAYPYGLSILLLITVSVPKQLMLLIVKKKNCVWGFHYLVIKTVYTVVELAQFPGFF